MGGTTDSVRERGTGCENMELVFDEPRREPFVSEAFKDLVEQNNLTGFKFELVWDSEQNKQH